MAVDGVGKERVAAAALGAESGGGAAGVGACVEEGVWADEGGDWVGVAGVG